MLGGMAARSALWWRLPSPARKLFRRPISSAYRMRWPSSFMHSGGAVRDAARGCSPRSVSASEVGLALATLAILAAIIAIIRGSSLRLLFRVAALTG